MILLLLCALASAIAPEAVPDPRARGSWVVDLAEILDAEAEARIDARLDALHDDLDVEVAVVTVQEADRVPKQFATALFNRWGVGDAQANNGLLVLMVMGERRLEMETGYGLEPILTDAWLGRMQARVMVPAFKQGDFAGGIEAGLRESDAALRARPLEARLGTQAEDAPRSAWPAAAPYRYHRVGPSGKILAFSTTGAALVGLLGGLLVARRRSRTCPTCRVYMPPVSEAEEDAWLTEGQQTEEAIGSRQWTVHACPTCDHVLVASSSRSSRFGRCPECRNHTRSTSRKPLREPTYDQPGKAVVFSRCAHCDHEEHVEVTLPRKQRPRRSTRSSGWSSSSSRSSGWSSSSSSSWSSSSRSSSRTSSSSSSSRRSGRFGGGRSGGGGAGSSW